MIRRAWRLGLVALVAAACGGGSAGSPPSTGTPAVQLTASPVPSIPATPGPTAKPPATPAASVAATRWSELAVSGSGPAPREDHTWTADPSGGALWLFGGRDGATVFDDLWRYDPDARSWTEIDPDGPRPEARFGHTGSWVPGRGLVVWSGQASNAFFADLWAYDPAANRWTELPGDGARPLARYGSCAALGPDGRLWISHGFTEDAGRFDDTRAYDFAAGRWTDESAAGPFIRCLHDCLFTADGDFVLYGGQTTGTPAVGDLWTRRAGGGWTEIRSTSSEPPARQLYALGQTEDAAWIFGGGAGDRSKLGDLWRLDLEDFRWSEVVPEGTGPAARSGAAMARVPGSGELLLFGGTDGDVTFGDLWALTPGD